MYHFVLLKYHKADIGQDCNFDGILDTWNHLIPIAWSLTENLSSGSSYYHGMLQAIMNKAQTIFQGFMSVLVFGQLDPQFRSRALLRLIVAMNLDCFRDSGWFWQSYGACVLLIKVGDLLKASFLTPIKFCFCQSKDVCEVITHQAPKQKESVALESYCIGA